MSRPTVRLQLTSDAEESISLGSSRIGGIPDLPPKCAWPTERDTITPLSFIAQINLLEISAFDEQDFLPKKGILYFFYSAEQDAWGYDSQDADKFKVLFFEGNSGTLQPVPFPEKLEEEARFATCALLPQQEISFSFDATEFELLTEEEQETIFALIDQGHQINKMLGYADAIQGEMELECELVTNGLYCGDSSGYNDPRAKVLEPKAADWLLLLQVDSNEAENGMIWGDAGRLYFWIKKQDLLARNFDKIWCVLQCY